jgi:hypothetical protein
MMRLLVLATFLLAAGSAAADIRQVPGAIAAGDSAAAAPADTMAAGDDFQLTPALLERLGEEDCRTVAGYAYRALPFWIVGGDAASVFDFLFFWESRCGADEPVQRMWILATIWEGAFDESYYGEDVTDHLIARWEGDPDDRSTLRADFDAFTVDMADQMLPHQPRGSVEEFWCLFYSGRVGEAWALLDGSTLSDTWVRHYRDETVARHRKNDRFGVLLATGGYWSPGGDVAFAGDKPTWGFLGGMRGRDWLVRGILDVRAGRTDEPYLTEDSDRYGRSNRFDATLLAIELGRIVRLSPRQAVDLFFGVGADLVVPYRDGDVALVGGHLSLGAGYRFFAGRYRDWTLGVDVRREWIGERNPGRYSMSGNAWSVRVGFGYAFAKARNRTLEGLGRP